MRRTHAYSYSEAERVQPEQANPPAHDAVNRLLPRMESTTEALWSEAQKYISVNKSILVIDDSALDKFYAQKIELVTRHCKKASMGGVVQGINLITLLWTQGDSHISCDYQIYDKSNDGATKNDHFRARLQTAKQRFFQPTCLVFDGWYSSLENLKMIHGYGWLWLTRLKRNRLVNPDGTGNLSLH